MLVDVRNRLATELGDGLWGLDRAERLVHDAIVSIHNAEIVLKRTQDGQECG